MAIVNEGELSYEDWARVGNVRAGAHIGMQDEDFLRVMAGDEYWWRKDLARAELARREALEA